MWRLLKLFVIPIVIAIAAAVLLPGNEAIISAAELPGHLRMWHGAGELITVNGHRMFVRRVTCRDHDERSPVVLIHGFPSSSYEFHRVVDGTCAQVGPVIAFDHVGFGFSDKPKRSDSHSIAPFSFSCVDHAEQMLLLLVELNVTRAHFVAHDMGDTILAEVVGRRFRQLLPERFQNAEFFQSITFTNGGMIHRLHSPRLAQTLLSTPQVGPLFGRFINRVDSSSFFFRKQLRTVWSSSLTAEQEAQRDGDIDDILTMIRFNGGNTIMADLIAYLRDRSVFESRWHPALRSLHRIVQNKRCAFVWGDGDSVAPFPIAKALHEEFTEKQCALYTIPHGGHFIQLEAPQEWIKFVAQNAMS